MDLALNRWTSIVILSLRIDVIESYISYYRLFLYFLSPDLNYRQFHIFVTKLSYLFLGSSVSTKWQLYQGFALLGTSRVTTSQSKKVSLWQRTRYWTCSDDRWLLRLLLDFLQDRSLFLLEILTSLQKLKSLNSKGHWKMLHCRLACEVTH